MTDNRTTELREKLTERGIEYTTNDHMGVCETSWNGFTAMQLTPGAKLIMAVTPEQAVAATLGSERDEIYNAGFDNGVKACLQILDGYLDYPHSAVENISKWVDEQWKEYES